MQPNDDNKNGVTNLLPVGQLACKTNWDGGKHITEAEVALRTAIPERGVLHREILAAADDEAAYVVVAAVVDLMTDSQQRPHLRAGAESHLPRRRHLDIRF